MEITQIEAFLLAARLGSFRRAAEELGISQPSLSARIQTLEQDLGTHPVSYTHLRAHET